MLRRVLLAAYDVSNSRLLGPEWLDTLRFDIIAKLPPGTTKEQFQAMLRNLLTDRFRMSVHWETKDVPIYALVPAKGGPKIHAKGAQPPPSDQAQNEIPVVTAAEGRDGLPKVALPGPGAVIETKDGRARISAREISLSRLAEFLMGRLDRPVIDMTGLAGTFDLTLYFAPDPQASDNTAEAGTFTALQEQLGLKLEPRRGPVQYLIVDRAEKVPTEN